jgi:predicted AlkP superfamily pyrophosphatase or phosphodiesterase
MANFRFAFILLFVSVTSSFCASAQMNIPPEKPKLIVQIVISQMRYDYLQRSSEKFSSDGFKLLVDEGAFCRNARFNYLLTQSLPGMATIVTGTNPSVHGIVSNKWFSAVNGLEVDAIADERVSTVGGSYFNGKYSPKNLITSTLGDEIRMVDPRSKVIGVSLEPSSSIISTGHNANGAYWLDIERGAWISNSHYMEELPSWVDTLNAKGFADIYLNKEWNLVNPLDSYVEADTAMVKEPQALKRLSEKLSRLVNGIIRPKKPVKDYTPLLETPYGITYTKDFAIAAIVGEDLGKDNHTDFIAVTFSPTRIIGNKYGPHSIEMEDTYLRLDRELAHFISFLNTEVGRHNYLLLLTSDQGVASTPEHLEKSKVPGGYFEPLQATMLLGSYLNVVYGTGNWVLGYHEKQIYLNRRLIEDSNLSLRDFQDRVVYFILQFTGVANAATSYTLQSSNFTTGVFEKFQNSFNQRRSGDIIINLEPGWVERNGGNVTSGNSPYSYDAHVPLIWYGWKMKRRQILSPVNMSDIAPTISTLIGISWPNGATGTPIREIIE